MSEITEKNDLTLAHMDGDFFEKKDNLTINTDNLEETISDNCSSNNNLSQKLDVNAEISNLEEKNGFKKIDETSPKSLNIIEINDNYDHVNNTISSANDNLLEELNESVRQADLNEKRDFTFFHDNSIKNNNLMESNTFEQIHTINSSSTIYNSLPEQDSSAIKLENEEKESSKIIDINRPKLDGKIMNSSAMGSLEEKLTYQKKIIEENLNTIKFLEEKCQKSEQFRKDLETKLETALKIKDNAVKEKENIVMRYAVGEKNVMKEKQQKEQTEKKLKETQKENEILQHKVQTMISEKSRICQMLDNKCYELKNCQQELDKTKECLGSLETKIKWSQNSLKSEMEAHRECQAKNENLSEKLQEATDKIEQARKEAEEIVKNFRMSQENRAYVLDQQVKEQHASLILLRHEKTDRDQQVKALQSELERLQAKQKDMIQENNNLSQKVQQLERERLETEQKLSELRTCADQQRNDAANLQTRNVQLDQLKMQLKHVEDQLVSANGQIDLLKQRNQELEADMEACRLREAELLLFTQQLTDKNVRLQSEFSAIEAKVQQLTTAQTTLRRQLKEQESKTIILSSTMNEEKTGLISEINCLKTDLDLARKNLEKATREGEDQKGENLVVKRKYELSFRELNRELQNCRKKLEHYESMECSSSNASSNSPVNSVGHIDHSSDSEQIKVANPGPDINKQTLIQHIVKLQKASAKKSEKIDFLEEHVGTLVSELQKKSKLLQGYILREQSGTLSSNSMDKNKAKLAKLNGIMASMYSSRVTDDTLTLELSLDINRKLQAVLEDALLKNITLKENIETLGSEIDRLNNCLKSS